MKKDTSMPCRNCILDNVCRQVCPELTKFYDTKRMVQRRNKDEYKRRYLKEV